MTGQSRTGRVVTALHEAGVHGLTVAEISVAADVRPYDVQQILSKLKVRRQVTILAGRQVDGRPTEVWGCRCPLVNQHRPPTSPSYGDTEPLSDATRERGRAGVAAAREALARATSSNT